MARMQVIVEGKPAMREVDYIVKQQPKGASHCVPVLRDDEDFSRSVDGSVHIFTKPVRHEPYCDHRGYLQPNFESACTCTNCGATLSGEQVLRMIDNG